jgi:BON domain
MKAGIGLVGALGVGAGAIYLWRPERVQRRSRPMPAVVVGRPRELVASPLVPDEVLAERVRWRLGRYVARPRAIVVMACQGHVTLSGPIPDREVDDLVAAIGRIPGVRSVENRLTILPEPADEPPATARWLVGAGGGLLALWGLSRLKQRVDAR